MALNAILHRERPSFWRRFHQAPLPVCAQILSARRQRLIDSTNSQKDAVDITVVCISDTHNSVPDLPYGDLLIHAGDLTRGGTSEEIQAQLDSLNAQPHMHKVVIAGNHDIALDQKKAAQLGQDSIGRESFRWGSLLYLEHSATTISFPGGVRLSIFGHPGTRKHGNWAFQYEKNTDVLTDRIEDDVDILVTHSPPRFHLDVAGWGDKFLLGELWRIQPRLHVFGHIHEGYGRATLVYDQFEYLYEQVSAGTAGVLSLLQMALLLLMSLLLTGADRNVKRTMLVNASVVGGLMDEKQRTVQVVRL